MNDFKLSPDDPRLTAFALGELTGDERIWVDAAIRQDPALQAALAEIRATLGEIQSALGHETAAAEAVPAQSFPAGKLVRFFSRATRKATPPTKRRRVVVEAREDADKPSADPYPAAPTGSKLLRFPQIYYVVGTAAAACFAVLVSLREPVASNPVVSFSTEPTRSYREIVLEAPVSEPSEWVSQANGLAPVSVPDEGIEIDPAVLIPSAPPAQALAGMLDADLSLLAQARREQERLADEPSSVAIAEAAPVLPAAVEPAVATPPRERITFTPVAPSSHGAIGTGVPLGSIVSGTPSFALASAGHPGNGPGETVVLSAMRVSGTRAVGFATGSSGTPAGTPRNGVYDNDYLPRPPPGAKFLRGRETYAHARDNEFLRTVHNPLSTFSIDVDTASYANVRRLLGQGLPPPRDAVRIEELLNYFPYHYAAPRNGAPIAASLEVAEAPWAPKHRLVRIGLKAREVPNTHRAAASLVFLLDVSSSMNQPNKLPLVKQSLRLLIGRLRPDDRVAIVTYAGSAGLVLPSTPVAQTREILNALDGLTPTNGSNGSSGIHLAYEIAQMNFRKEGTNRVILCTDGDFNLGVTSEGDLMRYIEGKARTGVFLTVLGFGMGNYKDATLEKLADSGNGNYGYIDSHREAEKLLVEQVSSTLVTVAEDVKVQVEFNPARVASYRLIGYENRLLRKEDFNLDKVDAGEIGAGHTMTALYEIVPVGVESDADFVPVDELKYAPRGTLNARLEMPGSGRDAINHELLTVKVRFKKPDSFFGWRRSLEFPLVDAPTPFARASADFRFAAAVAQFGMILRGSPYRGEASMADVSAWASSAASPADDPGGYRSEFIDLVRKTQGIME
jgi:Ca-activated chloride channel family protein